MPPELRRRHLLDRDGLLFAARGEVERAIVFERFLQGNEGYMATDHTGSPEFLARNSWHLDTTQKDWPDIRFLKTKEQS